MEKKESNSQSGSHDQKSNLRQVRTIRTDVVDLIRENKISEKDLSSIDPVLVQAAEQSDIEQSDKEAPFTTPFSTHIAKESLHLSQVSNTDPAKKFQGNLNSDYRTSAQDVINHLVKENLTAEPLANQPKTIKNAKSVFTPTKLETTVGKVASSTSSTSRSTIKTQVISESNPISETIQSGNNSTIHIQIEQIPIQSTITKTKSIDTSIEPQTVKSEISSNNIVEEPRQQIKKEIKKELKPEIKPEINLQTPVESKKDEPMMEARASLSKAKPKTEFQSEAAAKVALPSKQKIQAEVKADIAQKIEKEIKPEKKSETKPEPKIEIKPVIKIESKKEVQKEMPVAEKFEHELHETNAAISRLESEQKSLDSKKTTFESQKQILLKESEPLIAQEHAIELQESELKNMMENASYSSQKRELEEKRWQLEDKRQQIEKDRWSSDQKLIAIEKEIVDAMNAQQSIQKNLDFAHRKLTYINKQLDAIKAETDKVGLLKQLADVIVLKKNNEIEWQKLKDQRLQLELKQTEILTRERTIALEIKDIEAQEYKAGTPIEKHEFETKRWKKDEELRTIEKERWSEEEEQQKLDQQVEELEHRSEQVISQENSIKRKIKDIEAILKAAKRESEPRE